MENTNSSKKYREILKASKELFWKYGFRRVSIEEICRKADVSKMTFYRFFPNKVELAKRVMDDVIDEGLKRFKAIMSEESHAKDKIAKILQMKLEGVADISQEFLMDFYNSPELGLKSYLEEKTRASWGVIIDDFKSAQQKGWFRGDFKPELLMFLSLKFSEMIFDEKLKALYATPQELIMELANFSAYGFSPRRE